MEEGRGNLDEVTPLALIRVVLHEVGVVSPVLHAQSVGGVRQRLPLYELFKGFPDFYHRCPGVGVRLLVEDVVQDSP